MTKLTSYANQSGDIYAGLWVPQSAVEEAEYNIQPGTALCYRDICMGIDEKELDELLGLMETDLSEGLPEDRWQRETGGVLPGMTPYVPAVTHAAGTEAWIELARDPDHRHRRQATFGPLDEESWEALLEDRCCSVRMRVVSARRAIELLTRSPSGRRKLSEALRDEDVLDAARSTLELGQMSPWATAVLAEAILEARDHLPGNNEEDAPEFTLLFNRETSVRITSRKAILRAAEILAENYTNLPWLARDPRSAVRRIFAAAVSEDFSELGLIAAADPSPIVRRALNNINVHLPTEKVIEFLGDDPERICELVEHLLTRRDSTKLAMKYLADTDPKICEELTDRLWKIDEEMRDECEYIGAIRNDLEEEEDEDDEEYEDEEYEEDDDGFDPESEDREEESEEPDGRVSRR